MLFFIKQSAVFQKLKKQQHYTTKHKIRFTKQFSLKYAKMTTMLGMLFQFERA